MARAEVVELSQSAVAGSPHLTASGIASHLKC